MDKILKFKNTFDRITSANSTNWQLVLFWIIMFELFASVIEYTFFDNSISFIVLVSNSIGQEFLISLLFATFIWFCIYNFIFWNIKNFMLTVLYATFGLYLFYTKDLTFSFLLHNLEPLHFFNAGISFILVFELLIKLIITYLIFQLVKSYRSRVK